MQSNITNIDTFHKNMSPFIYFSAHMTIEKANINIFDDNEI